MPSLPDIVLACRLVLLAMSLLLMAGCRQGEEMGSVEGRVTLEGQPLGHGLVMFANQAKGVYMTALIGPDGRYEVKMAQGDGLPLGEYQVAVAPPLLDHPVGPILNPPKYEDEPQFPPQYRSWDTSPLKLNVGRGLNRFDIDLQP